MWVKEVKDLNDRLQEFKHDVSQAGFTTDDSNWVLVLKFVELTIINDISRIYKDNYQYIDNTDINIGKIAEKIYEELLNLDEKNETDDLQKLQLKQVTEVFLKDTIEIYKNTVKNWIKYSLENKIKMIKKD